jgi:hypothetical protein
METEHLQSVRFSLVGISWFIAVAVASLIAFAVMAVLPAASSTFGARLEISAIAIGFFAGGLFAGLRVREAPILHGTAIGLLSLPVWFVINLISAVAFPDTAWDALSPHFTVSVILLQIVAAILGARTGFRKTLRS